MFWKGENWQHRCRRKSKAVKIKDHAGDGSPDKTGTAGSIFRNHVTRYLLQYLSLAVVRHLECWGTWRSRNRINPQPFTWRRKKTRIVVFGKSPSWAKTGPAVSDIAGALALNNINILSAEIYTWRDGTAVDIFR